MSKPTFESADINAQNISAIEKLFPSCITETKDKDGNLKRAVDFEKLRGLLGGDIAEGDESYEFTWVGKKAAIKEAGTPVRMTLRPCKEESKNWDTTENLYIEGDNLDVLKMLQESYLGKVKMIYIDPPYNTGNDFIYNDSFEMDKDEYAEGTGAVDEDDNRNFRQNNDSNPRFHSDWCSMIYPRLALARNLLTDDGVIFVSIDDNEQSNLKKICDEIFGEENFVTTIHCQISTTQGMKIKAAQDGNIVKNAEYILCYSKNGKKNIALCPLFDLRPKYDEHYSLIIKEDGSIRQLYELYDYKFPKDCNNKGAFKLSEAYEKSEEFAEIVRTHLTEIVCIDKVTGFDIFNELRNGKWKKYIRNNKEYLLTLDLKNNIKQLLRLSDSWGKTDGYYEQEGLRKIRGDWWDGFYIDMGNVSKEGDIDFKNGKKPIRLIKQLVKMVTNSNEIILDFFSGSATTAHSVMQLNAEDGGNRKFIMVQLPEVCDEKSEAFKAGYKNICEIGKERIRRAGDKILKEWKEKNNQANLFNSKEIDTTGGGMEQQLNSEKRSLDIGFRVFKADSTNMKDVYYTPAQLQQNMLENLESNIKEDRTDIDLLYACLLDWGLPLSLPHTTETLDGITVHIVNNGDLVACFAENIPESTIRTIAARKPLRVVFRDSSFASAPEKINVTEIFKTLSPDTKIKVI